MTEPEPADALILVDVQRAFVEGVSAIPDAAGVVGRVEQLVGRARRAGAVVVQLQNDGPPGAVDESGTAGWELAMPPSPDETVIRKPIDDGFLNTELGALLDRRGVRRVVIAGVLSEMCVSATARGALQHGLEVVIARDAHGTYDLEDIPAKVVSRVAEHALGDQPTVIDADHVTFTAPPR
jgi:nicotinamidase-related amidase